MAIWLESSFCNFAVFFGGKGENVSDAGHKATKSFRPAMAVNRTNKTNV